MLPNPTDALMARTFAPALGGFLSFSLATAANYESFYLFMVTAPLEVLFVLVLVWGCGIGPDAKQSRALLSRRHLAAGLTILVGAALISGLLSRGATLLCGGMLVVFIVALTYNSAQGFPVDCGCFAGSAADTAPKTDAQLMNDMLVRIAEDIGMLVMVAWVLWIGPVGRPWLPGWKREASDSSSPAAPESATA